MLRHLGTEQLALSDAIRLDIPDIAEDGAIVPLTVETSLQGVKSLLIFAEKNPFPLVASFDFDEGAEAFASIRIKLNESGEVIVAMQTPDGWVGARKSVRVMLGGCG